MKIEFFSNIPGVAETFPVISAKEKMPRWLQVARQEFNSLSDKRETTITRCPGIIDVLTTGYIVTSPYDMEIHSDENGITTYVNTEMEELLGKPPAQTQDGDSLGKHLPKRPWSSKHILKINTPWHIKSSCKFMMVPIPYTDNFGFESTMGILDPSISSEVNVQGYVNGYGVLEIRAGQPICQLIPITEKKYTHVVRDMNSFDENWLRKRKFINNCTYILNKSLIKRAYNKFIKEK